MTKTTYSYILYGLSLAGTLFSGYLSGVKFFTKTCAFGETCPQFFGYPACYFGFIIFVSLFILSTLLVFRKDGKIAIANSILALSLLGVVFAGTFVVQELIRFAVEGFKLATLGLPTCVYGLIFYMLVLVFILRYKKTYVNEKTF